MGVRGEVEVGEESEGAESEGNDGRNNVLEEPGGVQDSSVAAELKGEGFEREEGGRQPCRLRSK